MRLDLRTFQYLSRAKILIHHGDQTDRKDPTDKKQAYIQEENFVFLLRISSIHLEYKYQIIVSSLLGTD